MLCHSRHPGQRGKAGVAMEREVREAKKLPSIDTIRCGHEGRNRVYRIGVALDPLAKSIDLTRGFDCECPLLGVALILMDNSEAADRDDNSTNNSKNRGR